MSRSRVRQRRNNRRVYIRHSSGQYVRQVVCGYVPEVYTNNSDKPVEFRWWEADRLIRKMLSSAKAAEYTIVELEPTP